MPHFRVKLERTVTERQVCEIIVEAKDVGAADRLMRADAKANNLVDAPWGKDISYDGPIVVVDVDEIDIDKHVDFLDAAE